MANGTYQVPGFTEEDISKATAAYEKAMRPRYERELAQLKTALGGRGTLYGTPWLEKGGALAGALAGSYLGGLGEFEAGLRQTGMEKAYERPFKEAELTGYYTPAGGTPQQTLQREYEMGLLSKTEDKQALERTQAAFNMLAQIISALSGVAGSSSDWKKLLNIG